MWIGKPTAKKIIMYIHGGGFVLPIATHMLQMARYMREESEKASGQEVAVAVVEYCRCLVILQSMHTLADIRHRLCSRQAVPDTDASRSTSTEPSSRKGNCSFKRA